MILELNNVSKTYRSGNGRTVRAVREVSLRLEPTNFVAVQGPSGCGKTTLLLIAGALLRPDSGQVRLDGRDPYGLGGDARARFRSRAVGFVFQQFHLVPYLSVLDNVLAPAVASGQPNARDRAVELISHLGLQERLQHVPAELSTGERQRTALARALLNRPKLILADEPTGNLDGESARAVLGYLTEFAAEGGAVLLVTHDERASSQAQQVVQIREGKVMEPGPAS